MARKVRDKEFDTRTSRFKLKAHGLPHYRTIRPRPSPGLPQAARRGRHMGGAVLQGQASGHGWIAIWTEAIASADDSRMPMALTS